MLGRGMVREPGGVIFLSSGPDCRRCGLFIAACTGQGGPADGGGALQMLSSKLRWTILQRFASSQNLDTTIFHPRAVLEWKTQIICSQLTFMQQKRYIFRHSNWTLFVKDNSCSKECVLSITNVVTRLSCDMILDHCARNWLNTEQGASAVQAAELSMIL